MNPFSVLDLDCPAGSTGEAAAMSGRFKDFRPFLARLLRDLENDDTDKKLLSSSDLQTYLESLATPIIARVLSTGSGFGEEKKWRQFVDDMRLTLRAIAAHTDDKNSEQTFLKYWTNVLQCRVFKDGQLPVREESVKTRLFFGWVNRFICRRVARRDVSFIYSLSKGSKLIWPALGDYKKRAALVKHRTFLSRVRVPVEEGLAKQITKTSIEVFSPPDWKLGAVGDAPTKFCPSSSACLQKSRRQGGSLALFDKPTLLKGEEVLGRPRVLATSLDFWMKKQSRFAVDKFLSELTSSDEQNREKPKSAMGPMDLCMAAVAEPGKYRIVSKGDGYLYSALQPLQGEMLSAWKRTPWSSMFHDDLTGEVRRIDQAVHEDYWCSVDYENATDLQKRHATFLALEGCRRSEYYPLAIASFTHGRGWYPDLFEGDHKPSLQEMGSESRDLAEGQPMGHPLSFPLLCVVNLAVYRESVERWYRSEILKLYGKGLQSYKEIVTALGDRRRVLLDNVLVNGDDMLFKGPKELIDIFYLTSQEAGFKISVGKNYVSRDCCQMNSQVFQRKGVRMDRVGYLNQRLVNGLNVKKGDLSAATPTQLGKEIGKMVRLAPWTASVVPKCFERFENDWHGYRPNWYLPVHLGGFGVPMDLAPPGLKITREQRLVAAQFVNDPTLALYSVLRAGGEDNIRLSDGFIGTPHFVFGDYVETASEVNGSAWNLKVCMWNRISGRGSDDSEIRTRIMRRDYRLKPMSLDRINEYLNARLMVSFLEVPCPPPQHIHAWGGVSLSKDDERNGYVNGRRVGQTSPNLYERMGGGTGDRRVEDYFFPPEASLEL